MLNNDERGATNQIIWFFFIVFSCVRMLRRKTKSYVEQLLMFRKDWLHTHFFKFFFAFVNNYLRPYLMYEEKISAIMKYLPEKLCNI